MSGWVWSATEIWDLPPCRGSSCVGCLAVCGCVSSVIATGRGLWFRISSEPTPATGWGLLWPLRSLFWKRCILSGRSVQGFWGPENTVPGHGVHGGCTIGTAGSDSIGKPCLEAHEWSPERQQILQRLLPIFAEYSRVDFSCLWRFCLSCRASLVWPSASHDLERGSETPPAFFVCLSWYSQVGCIRRWRFHLAVVTLCLSLLPSPLHFLLFPPSPYRNEPLECGIKAKKM